MSRDASVDARGFSTRSVHAGESRDKYAGAITTPIVQSSVFVFDDSAEMREYVAGGKKRLEYGRYGNPTQRVAEEKLAALEEAEDALLFATGMAAVTTALLAFLSTGDHVVVTDDCYRKTRVFCETSLARLGVESTFVRAGDYEGLAEAHKIDSIAFPAISTGVFGYPVEDAAEIAIRTITDVISKLHYVKKIRFVLYSERDLQIHEKVLTRFLDE